MLPVLGFDEEYVSEVHRTLSDAETALEKCHSSCMRRDAAFKAAFLKWFQEPSEANQPSVDLLSWTVEQMRHRLSEEGEHLVVEYRDDYDIMGEDHGQVDSFPNRMARSESRPEKPAREATDLRQKIDSYYGFGNVASIRLAKSFFTLERTSSEMVSQLTVFLHELSHWAAGTRDMKATSKADRRDDDPVQKCYGIKKGVRLAVERGKYPDGVMRAIQNADSVAYFVASYF